MRRLNSCFSLIAMRLLNSRSKELREFISDEDVPPYAILSHTWGSQEVTLKDLSSPFVSLTEGYRKIDLCCKQAEKDGIDWTWVDTYD